MKIIDDANGRHDAPTDGKSVQDGRLTDLEATLRRQQDWVNFAEVVSRERAARTALELELAARQAQYEIDIARAEAVRAMIDEQIREAALEVERARHAEASAAAVVGRLTRAEADAAARLAERENQFATELSTITATRDDLERQVREVESALVEANEQTSRERKVTAERQTAYHALMQREIAKRRTVEETLAAAQTAHADAATRLAEREAQFASHLSTIRATRDGLQRQLVEVEARVAQQTEAREALEQALTDVRSAAAAAEQRFGEEVASITETARADRTRLEDQLAREWHEHENQLADERQQHRLTMAAAAARLAEREEQFATEVSSIAATRDRLQQQLGDVEARLAQQSEAREALGQALTESRSAAAAAEQRFREEIAAITETARTDRSAMAAAATRLAEREEQFATEVSAIAATRDSLQQQLVDVEARLAQQSEAREAIERALAELRSSAAAAEQRSREEIAAITETARRDRSGLEHQLSEREAQFAAEVSSIAVTRDRLQRQLVDVEARLAQESTAREALEQALGELHSAAASAEERLREEIAAITATARADRTRLEDQLAREWHEHENQLADERQQHRSAMASAAARLAEREGEFADVEARRVQESKAREALEQALSDLRSAAAAAEQRFRDETASITEDARADRACLEGQILRERAEAAELQAAHRAQIDAEIAQRHNVEEALARAQAVHADAEKRHEAAAATAQAVLAERDTELESTRAEASATRSALERRVADTEAELRDAQGLHQSAIEAAATQVAERDAQLKERAASLEAADHDRAQLRDEIRRQFEESPVALCRCTRDGVVTDANQAFASLVGCRKRDDLRNRDYAKSLFEAPNDLSWLIEKSVTMRRRASVETTCRKQDGTLVAVRLTAVASPSDLIEIAAQDLTPVRVLEDRLKQAHRMEAVGRLASEIAVTCRKLLKEIHQSAEHWLPALSVSAAHQHDAERLLADLTRVSSFLEQVVSYGHEQLAALAPVDLNKVLRRLEPVLKQVAGDEVALEFRKTSSPIIVDVKDASIERLLINVASYGRERMPFGGRLKIELSTVVVDRKFTAQYPNVRQGPHAMITVTEVARPNAVEQPVRPPASQSRSGQLVSGRPGVDLGVLQELIADCGGHLWITAEPSGSMVVKMRLPLRGAWGQAGEHRILSHVADR